MRRATRTHLILLLVAAALGTAVWWTLRDSARRPDVLLPLRPSAVTHIDVRTQQGPVRRFERRQGHWWMLAPKQGRADDDHLQRLAGIAAARVLRWRAAADFDPKKIGLEPPFAVLHVDGHALTLGGMAALAPQRYVQVDGHIALIPARYAADIAAEPDSELAHAGSTLPAL